MTSPEYVFGPVPSRRLGRSLGIDLVPLKTCSFDCTYCQLGRTTNKTVTRKPWVPAGDVVSAVKEKLSTAPDYLALSGSGEPTLHSQVGEVLDRIKSMTNIPVAVLTNGSLLWQEEMRRELSSADVVMPSLDAGSDACFQRVNRPHAELDFDRLVEGLAAFRGRYRGQYWLEVFLLAGLNTTDAELARLVRCVDRIRPDRVQLNTVARPPAESDAVAVTRRRLDEVASAFRPRAEVICHFEGTASFSGWSAREEDILSLLRRRPCTLDDIACGLSLHRNEVAKYVEKLLSEQRILQALSADQRFYRASG